MRDDYPKFRALGATIVVVTRHNQKEMQEYWQKEKLPFVGVPDPAGAVTDVYGQQWKLFKLGRMPAQFVVDCQGKIAFVHYASGMSDIPTDETMLKLMQGLKCPGGGDG
jgi:peroxiredoxin Q/BCP